MRMALIQLNKKDDSFVCPDCNAPLRREEGGPVQIVNGKVDMDATLPKYVCGSCGVFYRELLNSGFFDKFPLPKPKKKLLRTGDIPPMELKRGPDGKATCPRCGERMDYVEGQPVRIVDGKPDMENVKDHFNCKECNSVFRRIATTDYFQWSEK